MKPNDNKPCKLELDEHLAHMCSSMVLAAAISFRTWPIDGHTPESLNLRFRLSQVPIYIEIQDPNTDHEIWIWMNLSV